jgi:imidazolonepropionase-like amidohydrolase
MLRPSRWWLLACASACVSGATPAPPVAADVAITDVSIVDVERGRTIGPRTVLVAGGRIAAIDAPDRIRIPSGAERVDGRGRFLIPGLVDMHVHLFNNASRRPPNTWAFPLYVAAGVTGVREMFVEPASMATLNGWRRAMAKGELVGPRIIAAGVAVRPTSPADAAARVDEAADAGADFIKVFSDLQEATWRAVLAAARRRSLPVAGHVPAGVSMIAAAAAGQRDAEHLMQAFEACTARERTWLDDRRHLAGDELVARRDAQESRVLDSFDRGACDRFAAALARSGQVQVPTLVLAFAEWQGRPPESHPHWRYLRAERDRWVRLLGSLTQDERAAGARRWPVARKIASSLHRAGVPLLAGTDAPMPRIVPGFSLHDELELFVDSGMSPLEALRASTLAPASFLGIAGETGSVAVGKRADLVLLDRDPLLDIRHTRNIRAVLLAGRLFSRPALDALLVR